MAAHLERRFPLSTQTQLLLEERSIDTAGNAREVAGILSQMGWRRVALLTVRRHLPAARTIFRANGIVPVTLIAAEDVVRERSPHHARWLKRRERSASLRLRDLEEVLRRSLLLLDPTGRILRPLTTLVRR